MKQLLLFTAFTMLAPFALWAEEHSVPERSVAVPAVKPELAGLDAVNAMVKGVQGLNRFQKRLGSDVGEVSGDVQASSALDANFFGEDSPR